MKIAGLISEILAVAEGLERPSVMILPPRRVRIMARLAVLNRMSGWEQMLGPVAIAEAREYIARKASRRLRMARKRRRGWM